MGDLLQEGRVAELAGDLCCGGDTPKELLTTWARVLEDLDRYSLRLSASKTVICLRPQVSWGGYGHKVVSLPVHTALPHCPPALHLQQQKVCVRSSVHTRSSAAFSRDVHISLTHWNVPSLVCSRVTLISGMTTSIRNLPVLRKPLTLTSLSSFLDHLTAYGL